MGESRTKSKIWYLYYTIAFAVLTVCLYGIFVLTGKSFIWQGDGLAQHYPILVRFYDWLHHGTLSGWSWNLGLGGDRLTTFSYYVLGDPFAYLIYFFPKHHLELGYDLLVLVRMYFSGLAFMLFARQRHFKPTSQLIGTLAYTFSGFSLYVSIRHPFFLLPMILFPLLAYAIDHIYAGKSWLWLPIFTGLALVSNFYFAYVLAIGSLFYAVLRYLSVKDELKLKLVPLLSRLIGGGLLGALLGAILFIPSLLGVLGSTRASAEFANGYLLYPFNYYLKLPNVVLTTGNAMSFWVNLGATGLAFLSVVYTMRHFRTYRWLNVSLILVFVGLILPQVAAVMNGGTTPSQRWLLLSCLILGLTTMTLCDHLAELTSGDIFTLAIGSVTLLVAVWAANGFIFNNQRHDFIMYGLLLLTLGAIMLIRQMGWSANRAFPILGGLVALNIIANGYGYFSPNSGGASQQLVTRGVATKYQKDYYDLAEKYVKQQPGFFRSNTSKQYYYGNQAKTNLGMNLGTHDIMSYFSIENGATGNFSQSLGNAQFRMNKPINQADNRTTMSNLMGVKYMFARSNQYKMQAFPYGYQAVKRNGKLLTYKDQPVHKFGNSYGTIIKRSKYALPLAYLQTGQLSAKQYAHLNGIDREQALASAALYDGSASDVPTKTYHSRTRDMAYDVQTDPKLAITDFKKLVTYRQQGNQLDPTLITTSDKSLRQSNTDRSVNVHNDQKRLEKLTAQNRKIVAKTSQKNAHGLTNMTSDNQNQPITYELMVKNPDRDKKTELYLDLSGISATRFTVKEKYHAAKNGSIYQNQAFTGIQRLNKLRQAIWQQSDGAYSVTTTAFENVNSFSQFGQTNLSDYEKRDHVLLNLGYSTAARRKIKVTFQGVKTLKFKSARLIAVPFGKPYVKQMKTLQRQKLNQLKVHNNLVTGTSQNAKATILTTSIPYSKGWKLTVDGKQTPTSKVNVGFVGAKLPAGTHRIRLTYQTPGLKLGVIGTIIGFLVLIGAGGYTLWKKRP